MEKLKKNRYIIAMALSVLALYANEWLDPFGYQLTKVEADIVETEVIPKAFAQIESTSLEEIKADRPDCSRQFYAYGRVAVSDTLTVEYEETSSAFPNVPGFAVMSPLELSFNEYLPRFVVDLNRPLKDQIEEKLLTVLHPGYDKSFVWLSFIEVNKNELCQEEEPQLPNK